MGLRIWHHQVTMRIKTVLLKVYMLWLKALIKNSNKSGPSGVWVFPIYRLFGQTPKEGENRTCLPRDFGSLSANLGKREGSPYFQASTHLYPQQIQTLSRCRQYADSHHRLTHSNWTVPPHFPGQNRGGGRGPRPPASEHGRKEEARQI